MAPAGSRKRSRRDSVPPEEQAEYEAMLLLERLESLREEMAELGVETRQDVERQIAALEKQWPGGRTG